MMYIRPSGPSCTGDLAAAAASRSTTEEGLAALAALEAAPAPGGKSVLECVGKEEAYMPL